MRNTNIQKTLSIISGVMLLLAIPSVWPYAFYQVLRWVVSIAGISNAYQSYNLNLKEWTVIMAGVAILFNPIAPITFSKGTWVLLDLVTAIIMFISIGKNIDHEK